MSNNKFEGPPRRLAIPRSRRLTIDVLHYHRQVPTCAHDRICDLSHVAARREQSSVRIAWPLLFTKAFAIVAARQKFVEGAVGMVEMALDMLSAKGVVKLDEERKAAMVSNMLVVLCSDQHTQPVVNTGTIYQ